MNNMDYEYRGSILLSEEENRTVQTLLGAKKQSLVTCMVQLLLLTPSEDGSARWSRKHTGVVCFVRDRSNNKYYFRLFCLVRKTLLWELQVHKGLQYETPSPLMHSFNAEKGLAAFNFTNEDEAKDFSRAVRDFFNKPELYFKKPVPMLGKSRSLDIPSSSSVSTTKPMHSTLLNIGKNDISLPMHLMNIKTYDMKTLEAQQERKWKQLIEKTGITRDQLRNKDPVKFIKQYVEDQGGVDAILTAEQRERSPPPTPEPPKAPQLAKPKKPLTPFTYLQPLAPQTLAPPATPIESPDAVELRERRPVPAPRKKTADKLHNIPIE